MGRTLSSFRPALENEIESWNDYKQGLNLDKKIIYDKIMSYARINADAGSLVARPLLSEVIFFSIALEQQKLIDKLLLKLENVEFLSIFV